MKLFSLFSLAGANRHIQHKIENNIDIERGIDDRYIFQFPRCSDAKCSNIHPKNNFSQKGGKIRKLCEFVLAKNTNNSKKTPKFFSKMNQGM